MKCNTAKCSADGGGAALPHAAPARAHRGLTDVILHGSLEQVVHVLSVQAVQSHADLVVQPLQPQLCKTTAPPESPPASPRAPGKQEVHCEPSARKRSLHHYTTRHSSQKLRSYQLHQARRRVTGPTRPNPYHHSIAHLLGIHTRHTPSSTAA